MATPTRKRRSCNHLLPFDESKTSINNGTSTGHLPTLNQVHAQDTPLSMYFTRKRPLARNSSDISNASSSSTPASLSPASSTTSLAELVAAFEAPLSKLKKRRRKRTSDGDVCSTICQECKEDLEKIFKGSVYMYRDEPYCSSECRDRRVTLDEIEELAL
mmetsp:Transcript_32164/g.52224  ORF Transcript_32164/g.52224 Transcript_32164/m.52224 type:complete len:160 (+) Transcript_32164:109-588(+)